jgi:hypothetical protein
MNTKHNTRVNHQQVESCLQETRRCMLLMSVDTNSDSRPLKRQKCNVTSVDFASVLSVVDIGIAKHLSGDYSEASECFCQALRHTSHLFVHSSVSGGSRAGAGAGEDADILIFSRSAVRSQSSVPNMSYEEVSVLSERHTKYLSQTEYDEGMRPHRGLLRLQEPAKMSSPEEDVFLAAALCFNIAQTFVERELYIEAIEWFHRSLDTKLFLAGRSEHSLFIASGFATIANEMTFKPDYSMAGRFRWCPLSLSHAHTQC